jgi:hypothetical protein
MATKARYADWLTSFSAKVGAETRRTRRRAAPPQPRRAEGEARAIVRGDGGDGLRARRRSEGERAAFAEEEQGAEEEALDAHGGRGADGGAADAELGEAEGSRRSGGPRGTTLTTLPNVAT